MLVSFMRTRLVFPTMLLLASAASAQAHGIAGNRYFPGTLTFDDPAVADEAFVPIYSRLEHPTTEGGDATDNALTFSFGRLLTPTLEDRSRHYLD